MTTEAETIRVLLLHNNYDADHLERVKGEMATLGAPTIRGVWSDAYGCWVALEGSHRLRAAEALGLRPTMVAVDYDDETTPEDAGITEDAEQSTGETIADIVAKAWNRRCVEFAADED